VILFYWPVDSRQCYVCNCDYDWETLTGTCSSPEFQSNCILEEVGNQYCSITSYYDGNREQRFLIPVAPYTFQDSHFFQAVETISLSGTTWLPTTISFFLYGCDWDGCNNNSLGQYFPESFQMDINDTILNEQLINGELPAQNCYSCSKCFNDIIAILCRLQPCNNGSCYIDEIHNYILTSTNNCTYNFYSYCQSFTGLAVATSIRIRATYYIDFPSEKQLEIDEVDITCTKDYCNSIETVEYLKGRIQTTININPGFLPFRPNDNTTTIETTTIDTTTAKGSKSTRSYFIAFIYLILFLFLL
jgi:hypothetical protein